MLIICLNVGSSRNSFNCIFSLKKIFEETISYEESVLLQHIKSSRQAGQTVSGGIIFLFMPQRIVGLLPSCKLLSRLIFPRMPVIDFPLNQKPVDGKHAASSVLTSFHSYFQRRWHSGLRQAGTHHQGGRQSITGHTPLTLTFTGE